MPPLSTILAANWLSSAAAMLARHQVDYNFNCGNYLCFTNSINLLISPLSTTFLKGGSIFLANNFLRPIAPWWISNTSCEFRYSASFSNESSVYYVLIILNYDKFILLYLLMISFIYNQNWLCFCLLSPFMGVRLC